MSRYSALLGLVFGASGWCLGRRGDRLERPYGLATAVTIAIALWAATLTTAAVACGSGQPPIVFTSDRDGNREIYSVKADGQDEQNLTNSPRDETMPVVSPDGKLVAFTVVSGDTGAIDIMEVDGAERSNVAPSIDPHGSYRWSPDSDRIAYRAEQDTGPALFVVTVDGSETIALTSIAGDEVGDWSRDGDAVVFAVHGGKAQGIYVRNPDGVNEFHVTETPDYNPVWSPQSRRIAFLSTRDGNPEIYVMNEDGTEQMRLTNTEEPEYHISWSPNGKRLVFVSEREGNPEIFLTDLDGTEQSRLTHNSARDEQPVWSPDGRRIAFVSYLGGDAEILVMDVDGKNQVRVTNNDAEDTEPSW